MNPLAASVLATLALSVAGNAALGVGYLRQRDAATAAAGQRDDARQTASACSDATADLRVLADTRAKDAATARRQAAAAALSHQQRADAILAKPPAVAGNDCASAQLQVNDWLRGRAAP